MPDELDRGRPQPAGENAIERAGRAATLNVAKAYHAQLDSDLRGVQIEIAHRIVVDGRGYSDDTDATKCKRTTARSAALIPCASPPLVPAKVRVGSGEVRGSAGTSSRLKSYGISRTGETAMYSRILVPVGGSSCSLEGLTEALNPDFSHRIAYLYITTVRYHGGLTVRYHGGLW